MALSPTEPTPIFMQLCLRSRMVLFGKNITTHYLILHTIFLPMFLGLQILFGVRDSLVWKMKYGVPTMQGQYNVSNERSIKCDAVELGLDVSMTKLGSDYKYILPTPSYSRKPLRKIDVTLCKPIYQADSPLYVLSDV